MQKDTKRQAMVLAACRHLDAVWIKFDCAQEKLFTQANVPSKNAPRSVRHQLEAIKQLENPGILTTLWRSTRKQDFQNWTPENIRSLLDAYATLKPRAVHLVTVRRKSPLRGLQPVSQDDLEALSLRIAELGIPVEVFA